MIMESDKHDDLRFANREFFLGFFIWSLVGLLMAILLIYVTAIWI